MQTQYISEIYVNSKEVSYFVNNVVHGIKELLQRLEDGRPRGAIHLVTTCKLPYLSNSMYPVSEGISPYQALCQREAGIAAYTEENIGTAEQWRQLAHDMNNVENLSALCENRLCSVKDLQTNFGDHLSSDADTQFLCFLCLKVFYSKDDSYLSYCLRNANCADNFKQKIFTSILNVAPDDKKFASWIRQRKRILSSLDENSAMMKDFCAQAAIKGKDILWYRSENDKLELPEHGQHSGRCCPIDADPGIEFATFEDGFAVLANYERFKGSRKADVETHGGASLEEAVIPVIILTLKPKEQQIYFVETVVFCSLKEGSNIRMFANPPLKKPRMVINGKNYDGRFDGDKHNIVFEMPELKRKGHHEAEIYDGGVKVALLTFETRRQTGTNQLF